MCKSRDIYTFIRIYYCLYYLTYTFTTSHQYSTSQTHHITYLTCIYSRCTASIFFCYTRTPRIRSCSIKAYHSKASPTSIKSLPLRGFLLLHQIHNYKHPSIYLIKKSPIEILHHNLHLSQLSLSFLSLNHNHNHKTTKPNLHNGRGNSRTPRHPLLWLLLQIRRIRKSRYVRMV